MYECRERMDAQERPFRLFGSAPSMARTEGALRATRFAPGKTVFGHAKKRDLRAGSAPRIRSTPLRSDTN